MEEGKVTKKPPPEYAAAFQGIEAKTVEELKAHIEALDKELGAANTLIGSENISLENTSLKIIQNII